MQIIYQPSEFFNTGLQKTQQSNILSSFVAVLYALLCFVTRFVLSPVICCVLKKLCFLISGLSSGKFVNFCYIIMCCTLL